MTKRKHKQAPEEQEGQEAQPDAERHEQRQMKHQQAAPASGAFSMQYLQGAVVILGILVIISAYLLGYMYGSLDGSPASTETAAAPAPAQAAQPATPPAPEVPKQATPDVELFIMSYCPYGLQMQKAYVQAAELLGGKANIETKWVSYAMHGLQEIEENTRQYCIQEEQASKYNEYVRCFVETTDTESCQTKAGIDSAKLKSCTDAADAEFGIMDDYNDRENWLSGRFPIYGVDADLNTKYGVRGSPTLVINGQSVSVARSAEAVKQAICNAFTTPPKECETKLNANQEQPSKGPIGAGTGAAVAEANCG